MTTADDSHISALLQKVVPAPDPSPHEDWDAVAERARGARSGRLRAVRRAALALTVASAAAFVAVLLWPASAGNDNVLERALAAVGDGPIIHVIYRSAPTATLVNLETGARTDEFTELEEWLSPEGAIRSRAEFQKLLGIGPGWIVHPPDSVSESQREFYSGIFDGYREALAGGRATLSPIESFRGRDVYWVHFKGQRLFDGGDKRYHEWAHEIAIDSETFVPAFMRYVRDGRPDPITVEEIVLVETLPLGAVDFTPTPPSMTRMTMAMGSRNETDITAKIGTSAPVEALGGKTPLWLGREHAGLELAFVRSTEFVEQITRSAKGQREQRETNGVNGLVLCYGGTISTPQPGSRPDSVVCDWKKPHLLLQETDRPSESYGWLIQSLSSLSPVPEGSVRLVAEGEGYLVVDGVYVRIRARSEAELLAAARALRPLD